MKTISKIIYTIIVCKFLMGIRERLMTKPSLDTSYCLLLEYFKDACQEVRRESGSNRQHV
jgi:hypothetical protein